MLIEDAEHEDEELLEYAISPATVHVEIWGFDGVIRVPTLFAETCPKRCQWVWFRSVTERFFCQLDYYTILYSKLVCRFHFPLFLSHFSTIEAETRINWS